MANEFKIKNGAIISGSVTGITEPTQENSTKLASTAWVKLQNYLATLPVATASVLGAVKVGSGLSVDANGVISIPGAGEGTARTKQSFTATAGQTTFTITGGYSAGLIDVYLNGVLLTTTSVTTANGTSIVLIDPAEVGDILDVVTYSVINSGFLSGTTDSLLEGTTNLYYTNTRARAAISLTTTGTSGAATYNSTTGALNIPQYQTVLTNPVTGTGTLGYIPKFSSASTIANSSILDSGTQITLGNNTYLNGSLGIGTSSFTGTVINISKTLTGATTHYGISGVYLVNSDVTSSVVLNSTYYSTQAATFTLSDLFHFKAAVGTIGSGSVITNHYGFYADSFFGTATNNYVFYSSLAAGTGRWNLFMNGTASNYLAGDTGIGTTTLGTSTALTIGGTETASSAIARGELINTTLVASANNDVLVGLDITPAFTNGAFTGVQNIGLRVGNIASSTGSLTVGNFRGTRYLQIDTTQNAIIGFDVLRLDYTANFLDFRYNPSGTATTVGRFFTTGNLTLQNGGTFTDAGYRLDVNGTVRIQNQLTTTGSVTATSAVARGAFFNNTLVAAANNDVLVGVDITATYTNGAFTGVSNYALRVTGNTFLNGTVYSVGLRSFGDNTVSTTNTSSSIYLQVGSTNYFKLLGTNGNIAIQNGGTYTDIPSARVAINSTTQGFLPPRMTAAERTAISSPATGLVVYQTDGTEGLYIKTATAWRAMAIV